MAFFVSLLLIITTGSMPGYVIGITKIEVALAAICILLSFLNGVSEKSLILVMKLAIYFIIIAIIQFFIYPAGVIEFLRIPFLLISYVLFSCNYTKSSISIVKSYYYAFMCLCTVSTVFYFIVEILKLQIPFKVVNFSWLPSYSAYGNIYYRMDMLEPDQIGPFKLIRNCGFFSEPGLYAVLIVLNIYIYLFLIEKKNYVHLLILLIALFTTTSTTGWLAFLLLIGYIIYDSGKSNQRKLLLVIPTIFASLIIVRYLLLQKAALHFNSYSSRIFDLVEGIKLAIKRPLFGWGYKNKGVFSELGATVVGVFRQGRVNSNGIISALYQLGVLGLAFYYMPFIRKARNSGGYSSAAKKQLILFIIVMVILLMGEPIQFEGVMLGMLAVIISENVNIKDKGISI